MFGLSMASKENFLAYSTQFIFLIARFVPGNVVMVAIDMCGVKTCISFYTFCLLIYFFVCLIIFLHFYICNIWFVVANNKFLVFIFKFISLKFITMFLPVNMRKFCKLYFNFYCELQKSASPSPFFKIEIIKHAQYGKPW